jgi:hypothetical protein
MYTLSYFLLSFDTCIDLQHICADFTSLFSVIACFGWSELLVYLCVFTACSTFDVGLSRSYTSIRLSHLFSYVIACINEEKDGTQPERLLKSPTFVEYIKVAFSQSSFETTECGRRDNIVV